MFLQMVSGKPMNDWRQSALDVDVDDSTIFNNTSLRTGSARNYLEI